MESWRDFWLLKLDKQTMDSLGSEDHIAAAAAAAAPRHIYLDPEIRLMVILESFQGRLWHNKNIVCRGMDPRTCKIDQNAWVFLGWCFQTISMLPFSRRQRVVYSRFCSQLQRPFLCLLRSHGVGLRRFPEAPRTRKGKFCKAYSLPAVASPPATKRDLAQSA